MTVSRQVRRAMTRYRAPLGIVLHGTTEEPLPTRAERRGAMRALRRLRPKLTHKQQRERRRANVALDVRFHQELRG